MWHVRAGGSVSCVSLDHARLTIVFDLRAELITGVVCASDDGRDEPFSGWMELTRAIERGLDAAKRAAKDARSG
jgi:hypothetical protein